MVDSKDFERLQAVFKRARDRIIDNNQGGGSPQLNEDGTKWRWGWMPKNLLYLEVDEFQALLRMFDLEEVSPVKFGGECKDCLHGRGVTSVTGLWPHIKDCSNCSGPSHPHFISWTKIQEFQSIRKKDVFRIPAGALIKGHIKALKEGREEGGPWHYYESGGFCHRLQDDLRICHMDSVGNLHLPGHNRSRGW